MKTFQRLIKVFILGLLLYIPAFSQIEAPHKSHIDGFSNIKITLYSFFKGGSGLSIGYAYWIEKGFMQQGINTSLNGVFFPTNLGNKNRVGSRFQINTVVSPITVLGIGPKRGYYEDINSFYFGNANAIQSHFKNYFAFGTNLVLTPKSNGFLHSGLLSDQNIYSSKNRSQQLIYLGFRVGGDTTKSNSLAVKFNFYEDFIVFKQLFQRYADHFDRFYTGGGNIEVKAFRKNQRPISLTFYDDVYTGSFDRDIFDFPDVYDKQAEKFNSNHPLKRRTARYVAHEPGQKLFNAGRFFGIASFPISRSVYGNPLQVMFGRQGGSAGMGLQDAIHDTSLIDKINPNLDPEGLYTSKGKYKNYFERLHHFYPTVKEPRYIFGAGFIID